MLLFMLRMHIQALLFLMHLSRWLLHQEQPIFNTQIQAVMRISQVSLRVAILVASLLQTTRQQLYLLT